jgi:hypothetical protein
MAEAKPQVQSIWAEKPGIGYVRWVPSGRLYWLAELGSLPVPADEFARRDARLAETIRRSLGASPYLPVTTDPDRAAALLGTVMETEVVREEGPALSCSCLDRREFRRRAAQEYADRHLIYIGLGPQDADERPTLLHCATTDTRWVLTYPGPTPHGGDNALLQRMPLENTAETPLP